MSAGHEPGGPGAGGRRPALRGWSCIRRSGLAYDPLNAASWRRWRRSQRPHGKGLILVAGCFSRYAVVTEVPADRRQAALATGRGRTPHRPAAASAPPWLVGSAGHWRGSVRIRLAALAAALGAPLVSTANTSTAGATAAGRGGACHPRGCSMCSGATASHARRRSAMFSGQALRPCGRFPERDGGHRPAWSAGWCRDGRRAGVPARSPGWTGHGAGKGLAMVVRRTPEHTVGSVIRRPHRPLRAVMATSCVRRRAGGRFSGRRGRPDRHYREHRRPGRPHPGWPWLSW